MGRYWVDKRVGGIELKEEERQKEEEGSDREGGGRKGDW